MARPGASGLAVFEVDFGQPEQVLRGGGGSVCLDFRDFLPLTRPLKLIDRRFLTDGRLLQLFPGPAFLFHLDDGAQHAGEFSARLAVVPGRRLAYEVSDICGNTKADLHHPGGPWPSTHRHFHIHATATI